MFRLHIDIPFPTVGSDNGERAAVAVAKLLMKVIEENLSDTKDLTGLDINPLQLNYRLGNDEDRQKSNYLIKNENGHIGNKKCRSLINAQANTILCDISPNI